MTREEALKIVRENYPHFGTTEPWLDLEKALATLIPELAESEDEKIRRGLVKLMTVAGEAYVVDSTGIKKDSYLAYLEKQKEQKPAEWSEEDEKMIRCIIDRIESDIQYGNELTKAYGNREISWLKSIRPSWKPSEEQMNTLAIVIDEYYHACTKGSDDKSKTLKTLFEQLKKM